jgi:hypothetical protein
MAKVYFHVRFRLSELIEAAKKALRIESRPAVSDALIFYWNWAAARGWLPVAVTSQMDPNQVILNVERNPQIELRNEEYWNVVMVGEEVRENGNPDLVEEMGIGQSPLMERAVVAQLREHGWTETAVDEFEKDGYEPIHYSEIVEACSAGGITPDEMVRGLVRAR